MNILFVTHAYPRTEGDVAGAFIERLARALDERHHGVGVVAPADRGRGGRDRRHNIAVTLVRYASARRETLAYTGTMVEATRSPLGALAAANLIRAQANQIRRVARSEPLDIVHAHWWVPGGVSAWMARLSPKTPYVVTLHGTDVRILKRSRVGRFIARRVLHQAARVTAVSAFLAERVANLAGLDRDRILVQPMPVEIDVFEGSASGGGDGIAVLGRLTKQKNLGVVLRALALLTKRGTVVPLRFIGDGPERGALEEEARRLEVADQVTFTGSVSPAEIPAAMGNVDVSVFPATEEGYGLAAAESLMLGIPVVALESGGGISEIVPSTGPGRLVPAGDPDAMARAIAAFLGSAESRRLAAEAGQSLKMMLRPSAIAETFESVYKDVLGTAG